MPTFKVIQYTYLCSYCGEMRKKNDGIPVCKVCGEFICSKCSEKEVCNDCLSKLNPDQRKLFKKKGKKEKILTQIFQQVYGPKFIIAELRKDSKEFIKTLVKKLMNFEDASEEFKIRRNSRVQETHNPNLWQ